MPEIYDKLKKVHFEPSTIENIDKSVLSFLQKLNLSTDTNEGSKKVPIVWGSAERAYQTKKDKDIRDSRGMLRLPIISVSRTSLAKSMPTKGVFVGNVPENSDEQGGGFFISRIISQKTTRKFANADAKRLNKQENYPRKNEKIVYQTVTSPMPVNVEVNYEITIRTEYQQQMNILMLPFITKPGTINYISLPEGEHRYEGFIDTSFSNNSNLSNFSGEERKFETKITLRVVGYLVGQGNNSEKPFFAIRENAVDVKIPKEKVITDPKELEKYNL